jgi:hypothetical protein
MDIDKRCTHQLPIESHDVLGNYVLRIKVSSWHHAQMSDSPHRRTATVAKSVNEISSCSLTNTCDEGAQGFDDPVYCPDVVQLGISFVCQLSQR